MALVYVDTGESGCSLQVLVPLEGDVFFGVLVFVSFSESKVNNIDFILVFPFPQHEVTWLDIVVEKILRMDKLYPVD